MISAISNKYTVVSADWDVANDLEFDMMDHPPGLQQAFLLTQKISLRYSVDIEKGKLRAYVKPFKLRLSFESNDKEILRIIDIGPKDVEYVVDPDLSEIEERPLNGLKIVPTKAEYDIHSKKLTVFFSFA